MDDPTTAQAFMNETVALQSYLASLQRELADGLSRVSRIVDLAVKAGLLPESSTAMPFPTSGVNPIIDRYQYHSQIIPVVPQVATPRALSTLVPELPPTVIATPEPDLVEISNQIPEITVIPTHVAIGLKWESQDYIDASKLDLETKKTEDLNPKPEGSSSKLSAMLSGSMKNVSIYLSSNTIGSLPMYNTDNKVSPDPAEVKESSDTLSPDLLMPYVPISIIEPEPEPLRSRRQSNEDKSPGARRRSSGQLSTFMEHRRPSMISRVPEEVSEATNKGTAQKAKWEKLRRQTMRDSSQIKGRKLSAVIQAAFPEIQRQNEAKKEHAKKNWEKLRGVVFAPKTVEKKNPKLAELMVSVLPDIETLHKKIHTPVIQEKKMTPYNSFSSFLHWFFLCPAFDEKGQYISIAKYHGSDYRKHRFHLDGFNPMSIFYSSLHLLLILFFIVILVLQPYQAAYYDNVQTQLALSWIISASMMLDTILNICTPRKPAKTDAQFKVQRPALKAWIPNYLKSHGIVDLMTIVPWIQVVPFSSASLPLSLLILLRTQRLPSMMARSPLFIIIHARIESIGGIGNILARIIPVGLLVIVFIHIQACCIYYVGRLSNFISWNQQFDHWVHYAGGVEAASVFERYIWMLSQAIGNTFPLTFKPETVSEQVVTIVFILLGAILYATFVGLISSAAISFDASGKLYRQKIDELTDYLNWKNIDPHTKRKLLNYYEFKYRGKYFEERSLLADMNESLRMELASINSKQLIEKVPFLKRDMKDGRDNIYLGKIATALNPIYFIPGDFIVNQGEQATEMFFILTGKVNIIVNGVTVTSFSDGAFFGEVSLIANIPRTASVQAITTCHLYSLSSKDFNAIILEFDDMKQRIDQIYEERMAKVRMEQAAQMILAT